jgi:hypothetical protein
MHGRIRYALSAALALALLGPAAFAEEAADVADDPAVVPATATASVDVAPATEAAIDPKELSGADDQGAATTGANPTHKQSALIEINGDGRDETTVQCFCLAADNRLLAGCKGESSEIRVFDADGKFVETIEVAVSPEAINVAPDGSILVAGGGRLLRLSADGAELANVEAPHAASMRENIDEIRKQVIEEQKQQASSAPQMLEAYDQAIKTLKDQLAELEETDENASQRETYESTLDAYQQAREQVAEQMASQEEAAELSEEQIDQLVESSMTYKTAVASISATEEAVFVATRATTGYGYDVWKTTPEFTDAEKIVTGLSGCCGQMDVQACDTGIYVAENSRHRVCRYDAKGELLGTFGKGSEGVDGFGSCCNPMNLAFGADGVVYTAEDSTGRIKRYKPDGTLLSVVGSADVVPGCKKVSIGVDSTGDRVFMLDITRNHIAVLSRVAPDPTGPISDPPAAEGRSGGIWDLLFGG